jgi:hypothetical protein
MRKGSKKPIGILPKPIDATWTAKEYNEIVAAPLEILHEQQNHPMMYLTTPTKLDYQILDLLARLCDACHEMDNKTEPWSTIRKDIEKLR